MKQLLKRLQRCNEELTILVAVLVFFISPYLLRFIDPTSGVYDAGVLQIISVVIVAFLTFQAFNWFVIGLIWPSIRSYFENHFVLDFNELTPWQKVKSSLSIFFFSFALIVALFKVL